jgi:hypothetical protein
MKVSWNFMVLTTMPTIYAYNLCLLFMLMPTIYAYYFSSIYAYNLCLLFHFYTSYFSSIYAYKLCLVCGLFVLIVSYINTCTKSFSNNIKTKYKTKGLEHRQPRDTRSTKDGTTLCEARTSAPVVGTFYTAVPPY